jgi:glucose/arabinose dehydrogenase
MSTVFRSSGLIFLTTILISCGSDSLAQYQVEVAFPNLTFSRPVDLQSARDGSGRLFVVEQAGVIRVFDNVSNVSEASDFLDIRSRIDDSGNEEGLLGLAFHPDYESNGFFFVNYTAANPDRTVVSRFSVSSLDADVADPSSERVLLTVPQPYSNHNGGQLQFGPDGMLYVALGDGGSGGDPMGNGQDRTTLLGSILRIDVNSPSGGANYGIPPDNPFVGNEEGWREEIFAYGLRNPWRFSFDSETGELWAGDVGQNAFEEVDIIESGGNYGWKIMEAYSCYNAATCDQSGLELPAHAYPHEGGNNSITGGYVYRGSTIPSLSGRYVYGDFVSGRIWALTRTQSGYTNDLLVDTSFGLSSFGVDENNELLVCGFDGRIHRITYASTSIEGSSGPTGALLQPPYPNPSGATVHLPVEVESATVVRVVVHDALGRRVANLLDGLLTTGRHLVSWTGHDESGVRVAAGLYWIRVTTNIHGTASAAVIYRPS